MFIAIICEPACDVFYFENGRIFLIKLFFLHDQKAKTGCGVINDSRFPGCDVINFEINLIFLIEPFVFLHDQKVKTKVQIS